LDFVCFLGLFNNAFGIYTALHDDSDDDDGSNGDNCDYSSITRVLCSLLVRKKEGILDTLLLHTHYY
jgi:hypothetical protein